MPTSQSEIASWVQAFGSIAAIVAAFVISSSQFRAAARLQREASAAELERKRDTLLVLLESAIEEMNRALLALRSKNPVQLYEEEGMIEMMEEFLRIFQQISPLELPTPSASRSLVHIRDRVSTAIWNTKTALEHGVDNYADYSGCVEALSHNIGELVEERTKLASERGGPLSVTHSP